MKRVLHFLFLTGLIVLSHAHAARPAWSSSRVVGSPEPPPPAQVERVFPRITFSSPVELIHDPVLPLWWIAQVNGQMFTLADSGNPTNATRVLDFPGLKKPCNQLLGFAFDPGYATNHFVYLAYVTADATPDGSRISRFSSVPSPTPSIDPGSERVLITWRGGGHNGCALRFGPDGFLYASTGDGSSPEPPDALKTGQNLDDLLSVIFRIDVHPKDPSQPYRVPDDNPFVRRAGARPEIWAYGFRNPWRMDFAPDVSLWVGDVGWELWETVHRVTAGYNGGWSRMEGPQNINADQHPPTPIQPPVAAHPHSEAASITGGVFHRGRALPKARNHFVYGDWETGKIWILNATGNSTPIEIADTPLRIIAFANGADSETYLLDYQGGGIHRLIDNPHPQSTDFPRRLSQTGLFSDTASAQPAPGVVAYEVAAPRWHDGASAQRWIAVPGDAPITPGSYPAGTVFAKTLSVPGTSPGRPIETQLLHFTGQDWRAYSYRWNSNATDADLVPAAGDSSEISFPTSSGLERRRWSFSARSDCLRCHNSWSGFALGFNLAQLQQGRSAQRLAEAQWIPASYLTNTFTRLVPTTDNHATVEARARSWLHVNCAPCHRFGAGAAVAARFGIDESPDNLRLFNLPPSRGTFGITDARLIAPGHPERSVLFHRIATHGNGHMPPVGPRQPDPQGARAVADWIRSLASAPTDSRAPATDVEKALALLDQHLPGHPPADATRPLLASSDATVRGLLSPDLLRNTLGSALPTERLLASQGDHIRGRRLFLASDGPGCAQCHRVANSGLEYGPDLSHIGSLRNRASLLESIAAPAAVVAPEHRLHQIELADGEFITGIVVSSSPDALQIRSAPGVTRTLTRSSIRQDVLLSGSTMPEGLLANLTFDEAADLLAFLEQLK